MRAAASTRGSATVLPAASAARTSGSVSHSLWKGKREQHGLRGHEFRQRRDLRRRSPPMRRRDIAGIEGVAPVEHLAAQRELRRAQRGPLRRIRVAACGGCGHRSMVTHRARPERRSDALRAKPL